MCGRPNLAPPVHGRYINVALCSGASVQERYINVASRSSASVHGRYYPTLPHPTPPQPRETLTYVVKNAQKRAVPMGSASKKMRVFRSTAPPTKMPWMPCSGLRRLFPSTSSKWSESKWAIGKTSIWFRVEVIVFGTSLYGCVWK